MTVREFALPDLGEGLTESDLVSWHVAEGDAVTVNQVIADVETAKALVSLPCPFEGVVHRLLVAEGETVPVGTPILSIEVADAPAAGAAGDPAAASGTSDDEPTEGAAAPVAGRTAVLVGYGPAAEGGPRRRRARRGRAGHDGAVGSPSPSATSAPSTSATSTSARTPSTTAPESTTTSPRAERPRSTPPVRKLAKDRGIDLTEVSGTGPDGLITRQDVLDHDVRGGTSVQGGVARTGSTASSDPSDPGGTAGALTGLGGPREVRMPIVGVRKHTAAAMVSSAFTAPHVTEFLTVDVTPTLELLEEVTSLKAFAGRRVTVLTMVAKALLVALRRSPLLNSRWDEQAGEIVQFGYVNLGIAAATPRGLLVPHIKDADRLDLAGLADALSELTRAAREGSTSPRDLVGGTISITNIGVFGIDAGTPILNPGEAAILAVGAARRQPWEHEGGIALRSVMTLSLSFDHRLVDGEQASRFLADVGTLLSRPGMALTMV